MKVEIPDRLQGIIRGPQQDGAQQFDPSGLVRPMKAWVVVPLAQSGEWERLAQLALASVGD